MGSEKGYWPNYILSGVWSSMPLEKLLLLCGIPIPPQPPADEDKVVFVFQLPVLTHLLLEAPPDAQLHPYHYHCHSCYYPARGSWFYGAAEEASSTAQLADFKYWLQLFLAAEAWLSHSEGHSPIL